MNIRGKSLTSTVSIVLFSSFNLCFGIGLNISFSIGLDICLGVGLNISFSIGFNISLSVSLSVSFCVSFCVCLSLSDCALRTRRRAGQIYVIYFWFLLARFLIDTTRSFGHDISNSCPYFLAKSLSCRGLLLLFDIRLLNFYSTLELFSIRISRRRSLFRWTRLVVRDLI